MATLALSLAGQVVGGLLGGPVGATIGRALGALAGSAVDSAIFGQSAQPSRAGSDIRLTGSSEGVPVPRVYGWSRIAGNIIWATDLERLPGQSAGAKGFGAGQEEDAIVASFALALCEGPVAHLGRIWADGKLLETEGLNIRFYRGTADQQPDGFMAARQGAEVPGYRGLCYLVFERLPLKQFGNRIPNISAEISRPVGELERDIRAVCLVPGATEFGYDPSPRVRIAGLGRTAPENTHVSGLRSDWDISIDELTALCPNLEHVGLVVAWFGTDLRCGQCTVEPRVEAGHREIKNAHWAVAGRSRATANVVSSHDGGPAYGGTPSDAAVLAAIADLRPRGLRVTLYPFVMMDIPETNDLTDPHTLAAGQPSYPWRGCITCHPAPGVVGSPDGTSAASVQVTAFVNAGYREMILHYAGLAQAAGGIDAILIGSEMRGLTQVRSGAASFPFVDALKALAGDVRGIVGAGTKITYAADWTEYFGYRPPDAPGDMVFHLDPLWADANIDAVGIDNYMPLADWRDGKGHPDSVLAKSIYDAGYLAANISGGEGFDWHYASDADRMSGTRTPIIDGEHDEAWVWRYKDLVNWWSQPHHNRIGGVRSETPTEWVPASKPIWLTELGCGAVDKGPNAPNAFGDPKSSEDRRPWFSSGLPDTLVQRQMLRANLAYWKTQGGAMLDVSRIYLWCWDARPYPAFPALDDVWSDAANYSTGHWLNGRLGAAALDELIFALAGEYGVPVARIDVAPPLVQGLTVEAVASMRDIAAMLVETSGLAVRDGPEGMSWIVPDDRHVLSLGRDDLVRADGPVVSRWRGDPAEAVGSLSLSYADRDRDYQAATVLALNQKGTRVAAEHSGLVLDPAAARTAAQSMIVRMSRGSDTLNTFLPPSLLAVEPADLIEIDGERDGPFLVGEVRDGTSRTIGAKAHGEAVAATVLPEPRRFRTMLPQIEAAPLVIFAHLPVPDGGTELAIGTFADPWPGEIEIRDATTGASFATLNRPAFMGALEASMPSGPAEVWSHDVPLLVQLQEGHLASATDDATLSGVNRIAVRLDDGSWEIVGFAEAELIGPGLYRLDRVLRGLGGTQPGTASAGAPVLVLDSRIARISVPQEALGSARTLRVYAGAHDAQGTSVNAQFDLSPALPLAPVHLRAERDPVSGDVTLRWIRRSRAAGSGWEYGDIPLDFVPERYRVRIFDGGDPVREIDCGTPQAVYTAADQTADFGALPSTFAFSVAQIGPVLGPGGASPGVFP
ncbi:baseplate multidomain protein megatron [Pelagibacterium limicola]|uniref:baseplate multidomain protein megatron n=1 Tax=Pelagibacterium limicola TaxID=2791022 RepID=UPI0018AF8904|nr:glycoside hydrolase/phage tail family protein [Pelagibacterium limicola]